MNHFKHAGLNEDSDYKRKMEEDTVPFTVCVEL